MLAITWRGLHEDRLAAVLAAATAVLNLFHDAAGDLNCPDLELLRDALHARAEFSTLDLHAQAIDAALEDRKDQPALRRLFDAYKREAARLRVLLLPVCDHQGCGKRVKNHVGDEYRTMTVFCPDHCGKWIPLLFFFNRAPEEDAQPERRHIRHEIEGGWAGLASLLAKKEYITRINEQP